MFRLTANLKSLLPDLATHFPRLIGISLLLSVAVIRLTPMVTRGLLPWISSSLKFIQVKAFKVLR